MNIDDTRWSEEDRQAYRKRISGLSREALINALVREAELHAEWELKALCTSNGSTENVTFTIPDVKSNASLPISDTYPILEYFAYKHLPKKLQAVSNLFSRLAWYLVCSYPKNEEMCVGLRKLLEAKDCFVRAVLCKGE